MSNMRKKKKLSLGQILLNIFFIILSVMVVFPFILLVIISVSNERDIIKYGYSIIPKNIDFSAYQYIFKNASGISNAYKVTIIVSVAYMVLSVFFMALIAYPLSRKTFKGKNIVSFYLYFTMLFGGGMVPTYILVTQYYHLGDNLWVYILPALISPWYVFMIRTFFAEIPNEIVESAYIDGASEYRIFLQIIIPMSKSVIATVALFQFLAKWNDWNTALLYINDETKFSLQYLLQRILQNMQAMQNTEANMSSFINAADIPSETARMAMAVVVAGPALIVFPFFQKYFVKGLTVGGVKG